MNNLITNDDESLKVDVAYDLNEGLVRIVIGNQGYLAFVPDDARRIANALLAGADKIEQQRSN